MKRLWLALTFLAAAGAAPGFTQITIVDPAQPAQYPISLAPLNGSDGQPRGYAQVQLTVEPGVYRLSAPGHLRAYTHRYHYTLRNMDAGDSADANFLTRFAVGFCQAAPITGTVTVVDGDGDPASWAARTTLNDPVSLVDWEAPEDPQGGIPPRGVWSFDMVTNAEPQLGFLFVRGSTAPPTGDAPVTADGVLQYWAPGCTETRAGAAELDWDLSVDATRSSAGHLLSYTLHLTNVGSAAANGVVLTDPLPDSVAYVAGTTTLNGKLKADPFPGVCALSRGMAVPLLAPGGSVVVRFQVRIRPGQPGGASIQNVATVTTSETDPLPGPAAVTTLLPPDTTPPVITISSPAGGAYTKPESLDATTLPVQFQIADADPGIDPATVQATFDGAPIHSGDSLSLGMLLPGPHTLEVRGVDWAGNAADATVTFTVAPTLKSTEYDILRMQQLGWIPRWRTASALIQILEVARQRFWDPNATRASLQALLTMIANPHQSPLAPPLMSDAAAAQLTATVHYLMGQLQVPVPVF